MKCPHCETAAYHWALLEDHEYYSAADNHVMTDDDPAWLEDGDAFYTKKFFVRSFQCHTCGALCSQRVDLGQPGHLHAIKMDLPPSYCATTVDNILLVAGSRSIKDEAYVTTCIDEALLRWNLTPGDFMFMVNGAAAGVDRIALTWAEKHKMRVRQESPDWAKKGKAAGVLRSMNMVKIATHVITIWKSPSPGTLATRKEAIRLKKQLQDFPDPLSTVI
jgi:hypothetical protein